MSKNLLLIFVLFILPEQTLFWKIQPILREFIVFSNCVGIPHANIAFNQLHSQFCCCSVQTSRLTSVDRRRRRLTESERI